MTTPLEQQLRDYTDSVEGRLGGVTAAEIIGSDTTTGEVLRPVRHRASRRWPVVAIAAAAGVLIGGASLLVWSGNGTDGPPATDPDAAATATEPPVISIEPLTAVVPQLGVLEWEQVLGDSDSVPTGFQEYPEGGFMSVEGNRVWRSDDGVTWTWDRASEGLGGSPFVSIRGEWATVWGRDHPLHRLVGGTWEPVELESGLPDLTGVVWDQWASTPVESAGRLVVVGGSIGTPDFIDAYGRSEIECGGETEATCEFPAELEWASGGEELVVRDPDDWSPLGRLLVTTSRDTVEFTDVLTGERMHTIGTPDDFSPDELLRQWRADDVLFFPSVWVSDGGEFERVEPPWQQAEVLALPAGGFLAFERADEGGGPETAHIWTSPDGRTWIDRGAPSFVDGQGRALQIEGSATHLRATLIDGPGGARSWVSSDGVSWAEMDVAFPAYTHVVPASFGEVATAMPDNRNRFWVSTDGDTWYEVEGPPGSHMPGGAGSGSAGAAGDLLFVAISSDSGPRTLWIGRFVDEP